MKSYEKTFWRDFAIIAIAAVSIYAVIWCLAGYMFGPDLDIVKQLRYALLIAVALGAAAALLIVGFFALGALISGLVHRKRLRLRRKLKLARRQKQKQNPKSPEEHIIVLQTGSLQEAAAEQVAA